MEQRKFKAGLSLNDNITITMTIPISDAMSAIAEYSSPTYPAAAGINAVLYHVYAALLDPLYLKEREAEIQHQADQQQMMAQQFFGQDPDVPPNWPGGEAQ